MERTTTKLSEQEIINRLVTLRERIPNREGNYGGYTVSDINAWILHIMYPTRFTNYNHVLVMNGANVMWKALKAQHI